MITYDERRCKNPACKALFIPSYPSQICCSTECRKRWIILRKHIWDIKYRQQSDLRWLNDRLEKEIGHSKALLLQVIEQIHELEVQNLSIKEKDDIIKENDHNIEFLRQKIEQLEEQIKINNISIKEKNDTIKELEQTVKNLKEQIIIEVNKVKEEMTFSRENDVDDYSSDDDETETVTPVLVYKPKIKNYPKKSQQQKELLTRDILPRKCHDCGKPTSNYRCSECLAKWKQKHCVSGSNDSAYEDI